MHRYRRLRWLIGGGLLAYFVIGMGAELALEGDVYPVSSWFLFDTVPEQRTEYGLLIIEFADLPLLGIPFRASA